MGPHAPRDTTTLARTYAAAAAAYVYGLPLVDLHDQVRTFKLPNTVISLANLATPSERSVVSPNNDTAYSVAWIDLTNGPLVFDVPDTGGRFYTIQFMDAYTNAHAYVGSGSTGTRAGSFLLVPPDWSGDVPTGITKVLHSPTYVNWLLGRTLVKDEADLAAVKPTLQAYVLRPLAQWQLRLPGLSVVLDNPPNRVKPATPTGTDFIATLNQGLAVDPSPAADACALAAFAPAGVDGAPKSEVERRAADTASILGNPSGSTEDNDKNAAIAAGTAGAEAVITAAGKALLAGAAGSFGWSPSFDWVARFGTRYLARSIIADTVIGVNTPEQAVYPTTYSDLLGRPLTGATDYTIRFKPGQLPPVGAFWSLTLYGPDNYLTENSINRYAIGDRTPGLVRGADGSLTIRVQHAEPTTAEGKANWLPAPTGPFHLMLRLYQPARSVLNGTWQAPPVVGRGQLVTPVLTRLRAAITAAHWRSNVAGTSTWTVYRAVKADGHTRLRRVGEVTHRDRAGANTLKLRTVRPGHRLKPGRYVARVSATDRWGLTRSATQVLRFMVR